MSDKWRFGAYFQGFHAGHAGHAGVTIDTIDTKSADYFSRNRLEA